VGSLDSHSQLPLTKSDCLKQPILLDRFRSLPVRHRILRFFVADILEFVGFSRILRICLAPCHQTQNLARAQHLLACWRLHSSNKKAVAGLYVQGITVEKFDKLLYVDCWVLVKPVP